MYEKIRKGIWSYNGIFHLVDSWTERDEHRVVFKFRLEPVEGEEELTLPTPDRPAPRRIIPTTVKLEVWKRDGGNVSCAERPTNCTSITTCPSRSAARR